MSILAKRAVGFGIAYFILVVVCYMAAFTLAMERFDEGDTNAGAMEYMATMLADVLMSPGKYIWTTWASKNLHDAFEWILFVANSALWGLVRANAVGKIRSAT